MQLISYLIIVPKPLRMSVYPLLTQAFHHAIVVSVVMPGSVGEENHTYHTSQPGNITFEREA